MHSNIRLSHVFFPLSVQKIHGWYPKYYYKLTFKQPGMIKEVCNWVSCWWEKVYDLIYSKRIFMNLRTWRLCQWWRTSLNLSLQVFFNYHISRNLSDTSINKNVIYANVIDANPLQKRICRSITSAIWKQKKTIWTTQVPSSSG